jgi:hypothetical protein
MKLCSHCVKFFGIYWILSIFLDKNIGQSCVHEQKMVLLKVPFYSFLASILFLLFLLEDVICKSSVGIFIVKLAQWENSYFSPFVWAIHMQAD